MGDNYRFLPTETCEICSKPLMQHKKEGFIECRYPGCPEGYRNFQRRGPRNRGIGLLS